MKNKILIGISLGLLLAGCGKEQVKPVPKKVAPIAQLTKQTHEPVSITTGLPLINLNQHNNHFAVMIENSKPARPLSGLADADLVYEMKVEYQITRYLAIYNDKMPNQIGPVRSARHYYLPLVKDLNIAYIHFGESNLAMPMLKVMKQTVIDGITEGKYFTRDTTREAPHNAYLYPSRLPHFPERLNNIPFGFTDHLNSNFTNINEISFTYNSFTHIKYVYNSSQNKYVRYLEGDIQKDRNSNETVQPTNIILLYAIHKDLNDFKQHIDIDFSSGGKAVYYSGGKKMAGTWINENGDLKFLDNQGNEVKLLAGKTWIQVLQNSIQVVEK